LNCAEGRVRNELAQIFQTREERVCIVCCFWGWKTSFAKDVPKTVRCLNTILPFVLRCEKALRPHDHLLVMHQQI
jgi:hypothetical protein